MAGRPRHIPKYARLSPDTASDDSSEEELPNFTLISKDTILPEGAKRQRKTRISLQQPLDIDEPAPSPARTRRGRRGEIVEEPPDLPLPKRRGRPPKKSPAPLPSPQRLKRRRIIESDESDVDPDVDAKESDDEEEPIRARPSRRSVRTVVARSPSPEQLVAFTRQSSSELSSPPESILDIDSDREESDDDEEPAATNDAAVDDNVAEEHPVVKEDENRMVGVEEEPAKVVADPVKPARRRGRPPGAKNFKNRVPILQVAAAMAGEGDDPVSDAEAQTEIRVLPTAATQLQVPESSVTKRVRELSIHEEETPLATPLMPTAVGEPQIDEPRIPSVLPSVERTHSQEEVPQTVVSAVPKKANSAAKRAPPPISLVSSKGSAGNNAQNAEMELGQRTTGPLRRVPRSAPPTSANVRPTSHAGSLLRNIENTSSNAPESKRIREIPTGRPSSSGVGSSSLPSPPVRGHNRHRSMDIASMLNPDMPTAARPFSPIFPPHLPHVDLDLQPFGRSAPESFLRSSSGPPAQSNRTSFAPLITAERLAKESLTHDSPNVRDIPLCSITTDNIFTANCAA